MLLEIGFGQFLDHFLAMFRCAWKQKSGEIQFVRTFCIKKYCSQQAENRVDTNVLLPGADQNTLQITSILLPKTKK